MKQVSIEGCLENVPNKFDLSLLAMARAKNLMLGAEPTISSSNFTKNSNIALKEIEENKLDLNELKDVLKESLIKSDYFVKNMDKKEEDESQDDQDGTDLDDDIDDIDGDIDEEELDSEEEDEEFYDEVSDDVEEVEEE